MTKILKKIILKYEEKKLLKLINNAPDLKNFKRATKQFLINQLEQNEKHWTNFSNEEIISPQISKINIFSSFKNNSFKLNLNYERY